MDEFKCTVKDIFRRANMIDKAVRELADKGFTDHAVVYTRIRDNIFNALNYAASNMKDYEYRVAINYLESRHSEQTLARMTYYTHRTIRRYIRKACEFVNEYYTDYLVQNTKNTPFRYGKTRLNESYKSHRIIEKIKSVMPDQIIPVEERSE